MRKLTLVAAVFIVSASSFAQDLTQDVEVLKKQVEMLTNELANLKTSKSITGKVSQSYDILAESASKPYFSDNRVSLGGYGEIKYREMSSGAKTTDTHRIIPYIGYKFTDEIIFNAEIEFEHGGAVGGTSGSGEAIVEFAYLDFLNVFNNLNIRVGHILIPVGLTNTKHEPTLFPSVNRPLLEKYVIPTTWHEDGIEFYVSGEKLKSRVGLVNSMEGENFKTSSWVRGGRQGGNGSANVADDWSVFARLDYAFNQSTSAGFSVYTGKVNQAGELTGNPTLNLMEAHFQWQANGWMINGIYVDGNLVEANDMPSDFGRQAGGYYVTLAYDIMRVIKPESTKQLQLFTRHSQYDLNKKVKEGTSVNDALNNTSTTVGLAFKPVSNVVIKADYQYLSNAKEDLADETHLGIGFNF